MRHMAGEARNKRLTTLTDVYQRVSTPESRRYELFRRKVRRLEQGNMETILNLARAAGIIVDGPEPGPTSQEDLG